MIVALAKQIREEIAALGLAGESTRDVRTSINATGVYWEHQRPVVLFLTGLHHAGEIVDRLLQHRLEPGPKLVKVTDGASKNFDHTQQDKLVEATCNARALSKFDAIKVSTQRNTRPLAEPTSRFSTRMTGPRPSASTPCSACSITGSTPSR